MQVIPFERLRFKVSSRSGQEPYLVDIGSHGGLGACDCTDFLKTKWPECREAKRAGQPWKTDTFRCWHIRVARQFFFDEVLDQFIAQFSKDYSEDE